MRVIAGKFGSLKLNTLKGDLTRPTLDKVKEAVFSKIQFRLNDAIFVDLYSGSGSIGIEAISRGCKKCYLNDLNINAYKVIKENINKLNITNYKLTNLDYLNCLNSINEKVNFIYIDPPFLKTDYHKVINNIDQSDILNSNGLLIVESTKDIVLNDKYGRLIKDSEKKYGTIKITYYKVGE